MSKSLGNGVDLGEQIDSFGVDAVRLTMVFAGPPEDDIDWADLSPAGSLRFLQRAWRLAHDVTSEPGTDPTTGDVDLRRVTHRTVHEVDQLVESHRFNVAVARVMELVNATRKAIDSGPGGADPAVREADRGRGAAAEPGRAVHRRGDVGGAGPPADGGDDRAGPRSTRRCWSRRP